MFGFHKIQKMAPPKICCETWQRPGVATSFGGSAFTDFGPHQPALQNPWISDFCLEPSPTFPEYLLLVNADNQGVIHCPPHESQTAGGGGKPGFWAVFEQCFRCLIFLKGQTFIHPSTINYLLCGSGNALQCWIPCQSGLRHFFSEYNTEIIQFKQITKCL